MTLLLLSLAHAENVPCTAQASGPGWRASVQATVVGTTLTGARQEIVVDIPAIDQGDSQYEYNLDVNRPPAPMARVRIVEVLALGGKNQAFELLAPEVYAPVEVMMAGVTGSDVPPLRAALRLVAGGQTVGWFIAGMQRSPADLASSNTNVYTVTLGDGSAPSADASRALDALAAAGPLRVETLVGRREGQGDRLPLPDHEDPAKTEVAGSFTVDMSALAPAMAALPGLQPELGSQLASGKCGDLPTGGGGKK